MSETRSQLRKSCTIPVLTLPDETLGCSANTEQDTVFIAHAVLRWSGHVEQDKFGLLGLLYDDLVESYSRVHAPHIHLVPNATNKQAKKSSFTKHR